jgi:hypothetical protein
LPVVNVIAVRSPAAEAIVPGYAGLIRPFNCVARNCGRAGGARTFPVIGNIRGGFDVGPVGHVTFSLPAGHRTEIGRIRERHSLT